MLRESPFHPRTSELCESWEWKGWAGYLAASSYQLIGIMEYYAIRNSAGLIDITPLYKYRISGKDAAALLNRVVTRDVSKLRPGQIFYTPWCDDAGHVVDDGTMWNFGDGTFRLTAAEPNLRWLEDNANGLDVKVEDESAEIAALALQGPTSRAILVDAADGAVEKLKYFRFVKTKLDGVPVTISRTGYTGDLGYEIWTEWDRAESLWDALMERGSRFDMVPAGMTALDIARIEAGLILAEVEFMPARHAMIASQRYSPLELGLDWCLALAKGPFVGRRALVEESRRGPRRRTVGLRVHWPSVVDIFREKDLPPESPQVPTRDKIPVYSGPRQIGYATSTTWSPTLKQYICIATVPAAYAAVGTPVEFEVTVEGEHRRAPAAVVERPFYDPPQRKA
jgi:aminomethyltransferase